MCTDLHLALCSIEANKDVDNIESMVPDTLLVHPLYKCTDGLQHNSTN